MNCRDCGARLKPNDRFCAYCGNLTPYGEKQDLEKQREDERIKREKDDAQYALGELYMKAEKLKEAYQWYYFAHLNDNKDAQGALDKIEGKGWLWDSDPQIPTAQIEQARAEARKMYEEQKKRSAQ